MEYKRVAAIGGGTDIPDNDGQGSKTGQEESFESTH